MTEALGAEEGERTPPRWSPARAPRFSGGRYAAAECRAAAEAASIGGVYYAVPAYHR
jgi:hypothetical protein